MKVKTTRKKAAPLQKAVAKTPTVLRIRRFRVSPVLATLPKEVVRAPYDHSFTLQHIASMFQRKHNSVWGAVQEGRLEAYKSGSTTLVTKKALVSAFEQGTFPGKRGRKPKAAPPVLPTP